MTKVQLRREEILKTFAGRDSFTKKEATKLLESGYYCNAGKYVGEILSRMVKVGLIDRLSRGVYKVPSYIRKPTTAVPRKDGNCKWCAGDGCVSCGVEDRGGQA